ncbi:MAG: hypothetical protein LH606_05830 [Cytophagaceae bacterium]|nr:hypothetical protein [Cytophagaceae bacterium]
MSQFLVTLVSADSHYDRVRSGKEQFTTDEQAGLRVFQAKGCASCHAGELITDGTFRYNGLQPTQINDLGRAKITELAADNYKFRLIPNVGLIVSLDSFTQKTLLCSFNYTSS